MSNLNERPTGDWAAEREFDLRADSYAQAKLWGLEEGHSWLPRVARVFACSNPEEAWVKEQMREVYDLSDPKHPEFHSVHVDLYDQREGK